MWIKIAEGSGTDLITVIGYEDEVEEGQRGKLRLNLTNPLSPDLALELQQQLDNQGVTDAEVISLGSMVDISYRKGFPWLPVIVAIILGLVALAILVISWLFYKEAPAQFSLLMVGGIIAASAVLVYALRRPT